MLDVDDENACSIDLINFSINKRVHLREMYREMYTADPTLCAPQRVVYSAWPDAIKDLPKDLHPYWSYRDEIGISGGVIFKGKQVIIPDALRSDILHQLHEAHLGIEKTRLLMRESVYWPNIYKYIEMMLNVVQSAREQHGASSTTSPRSRCGLITNCCIIYTIICLKVKDRVCFSPVFITYNKLRYVHSKHFCKTSVTSVLYH